MAEIKDSNYKPEKKQAKKEIGYEKYRNLLD